MNGSEITITFLGTGSAIPPNHRQQVSFALRHQNGLAIFDCGEGTQYSMRRYGISTRKELVICISHLHSDHFLGLPGLLASLQLLGRESKIYIIGPEGIEITVKNLMIANFVRVSYEIEIITVQPNEIFEGDGYTIRGLKALHEANALTFVWNESKIRGKVSEEKLKEYGIPPGPHISDLLKGKSIKLNNQEIHPAMVIGPQRRGRCIVYSGDTAVNYQIVEEIEECDLLIHEATYPSDLIALAEERSHSTVRQAAEFAQTLKPTQLVLTHFSPRIENMDAELKIAKAIFPNTSMAEQGMKVVVPYLY
ncbi:MAG: ribonuclease Z [Candidatus Kariarchaeaceae archaeon]|jgi:ribonuclease Z